MAFIENDKTIPSDESSNCSYCFRHTFTAANQNNPFLYYPIYAGHYVALDHYCVDRENFASLLILYTESGEAAMSVDDGPLLTILPGSVVVLDCRRHHIYFPIQTPWSLYYLHIAGRDCLSFANALPHHEQPIYSYGDENRTRIKALIGKALSMPNEISVSSDLRMSALIYELLMVLPDTNENDGSAEKSDAFAKFRYIESYMQEHLADPLETETLAKLLYMSRPYFSTLFRRFFGISPHQYLTALRIDRAKQLLLETNQPIGAIAAQVGYTDVSAFSRCFSRLTRMTPRQFREIR